VLRPFEQVRIAARTPGLLDGNYERVRDFDRTAQVRAAPVHGRAYLEHDAHFTVFRLQRRTRFDPETFVIDSPFPSPTKYLDGTLLLEVHAPGTMTMKIPAGARTLRGAYAFSPGAEEGEHATDGAIFRIELH
jgi:hypothetical protein